MKHLSLLASAVLASVAARAFVNTNAGSKLYICETAQPNDVNESAAAALSYVEIKGIGNVGETGSKTNILSYDTWDTDVIQKAKGMTDAGSPTIELARIVADPGQIALRAAALTNFNYVVKMVRNDQLTEDGSPTVIYNRGLISGPTRPNGKNEDFDLEVFTFGLQQKEIVVDAT